MKPSKRLSDELSISQAALLLLLVSDFDSEDPILLTLFEALKSEAALVLAEQSKEIRDDLLSELGYLLAPYLSNSSRRPWPLKIKLAFPFFLVHPQIR